MSDSEKSPFFGIDRTFAPPRGPDVATDIRKAIDDGLKAIRRQESVRIYGPTVAIVTPFEFKKFVDAGLVDEDGRVK